VINPSLSDQDGLWCLNHHFEVACCDSDIPIMQYNVASVQARPSKNVSYVLILRTCNQLLNLRKIVWSQDRNFLGSVDSREWWCWTACCWV